MHRTTPGRLLLDQALPEGLRGQYDVLDKKGIQTLFQTLAEKHPEQYREVSKGLADASREAIYLSGGLGYGLEHLRRSPAAARRLNSLRQRLMGVLGNAQLSDHDRENEIVRTVGREIAPLEKEVYEEALAAKNPLALQVRSGARGNPTNLRTLVGSDLLYVDQNDKPIPVPVLRSYSQGLSPAEYVAGSFGARKGVVALKLATAQAGYYCLAAGTLVRRPDGTSAAIEHIQPGETVLGADKTGRTFPVRVTRSFSHGPKEVWRYRFRVGQSHHSCITIEATEEHRVLALTDDGPLVLPLQDFAAGDHVCLAASTPGVYAGRESSGLVDTFDIEVDHPDHLFVLANGAIVSNSKQLVQAAHRLMVSATDAETPYSGIRGLPVDTDDPDNEGALLAHDAGPYKRNTLLTPKILADLRDRNVAKILVRSPTVGGPSDGGVYARDVGVRERGGLAPIGDLVGIAAAQALCLAEGTRVRMADLSTRAIEDIRPGDQVMGCSSEGGVRPVRVLAHHSNGVRPCCHYLFGFGTHSEQQTNCPYGATVCCTAEHKLLLCHTPDAGEYHIEPAGESEGGYAVQVLCRPGGWRSLVLPRLGPAHYAGERLTYDIHVDHPDHLFVLANGLVVSNSGGIAKETLGPSGFKLLDQMVQVPRHFPGGAAHAQLDGRVHAVEPAPQGGSYVTVGSQRHYVAPGHEVAVKVGDEVEAGDVLSAGVPNPAEVVQHKGIGEGRRYFAHAFRQALRDAGAPAHRRNVELLARGLINHVELTEEHGDNVPGDVLPYSVLESGWRPRQGHELVEPGRAAGRYLEEPALHYTIGTRVTPGVAKQLKEFGVPRVAVHADPPPFRPHMVRAMENVQHDPDWLTRMLGSNLQRTLLRSAHRGTSSDEHGTSFVPALARGGPDLGIKGKLVDWQHTPKEHFAD